MTFQYEFEDLLSSQQAANLLGVSEETVRRWTRSKRITPLKVGNKYRYRASELDQWLKRAGK